MRNTGPGMEFRKFPVRYTDKGGNIIMADFSSYFLMKENDVIEYARLKVPQMNWDAATMTCREIGDGNLNYVFKVQDAMGHSVIV